MKKTTIVSALLFFIIATLLPLTKTAAQPFSLDKKIKPVKLQLKDDRSWKGAKSIAGVGRLSKEGEYFYVKGASMFQPVDIFLLGPEGVPAKMDIVKNNWKEVLKTASTADAADEIANLKIRTYGDFGIRVYTDGESTGDYQVVIYASPEIKKALPSPFVAAGKEQKAASQNKEGSDQEDDSAKTEKNSSKMLLWIGMGILLLLATIILLLIKRKKSIAIWCLAGMTLISPPAVAQSWQMQKTLEDIKDIVDSKKAENLLEKIKDLRENAEKIKDIFDSYSGLGDCLTMPMPPGMPAVPSFCPDDAEGWSGTISDNRGDCARCFTEAREEFNNVRYNLEQLRIIYKCTKDFSDKAIAFGDNASGVHGVSGLAWQAEKPKIEQSVKDLKKAYDSKYAELLTKLQQSMMKLAECEEQFGTPDWYDRFGYMFYEFVKEKYKRSGD